MSASTFAEIYEKALVPAIFRPWGLDLLERVRPRPGDRVLDLACGTGIVARLVRERLGAGARITGADASPLMLAVARTLGPEIDWHETNAVQLPFEAGTFDLVLCQEGFQFFPDRAASVREMRRVLGQTGRVAISTWRPIEENPLFAGLDAAATPQFGARVDPRFQFGDGHAIRALLEEAGFRDVLVEIVTREEVLPDADLFVGLNLAATVPAIPKMGDEERREAVARVKADARETLARFAHGSGLRHPMRANVVIAQA